MQRKMLLRCHGAVVSDNIEVSNKSDGITRVQQQLITQPLWAKHALNETI